MLERPQQQDEQQELARGEASRCEHREQDTPGATALEERSSDEMLPSSETRGEVEESGRVEELMNAATEALAAGRIGRALALAREASEAAPNVASVWMLLGMVAEESGELREALGAYRRAHELDSTRQDLADRIEALEQRLPPEEPRQPDVSAPATPLDRYAPLLLACSVGFLVLAIGLALVLRGHRQRSIESAYKQTMEQGTRYMALQDYGRAEQAFTEALRLRPDDQQALSWLEKARESRQQLAQYKQWEYMTMGGRFPGVTGANPLTPAQILPSAERKAQEGQSQQAQGQPSGSYPSASSHRRYTWRGATSTDWEPTGDITAFPSPRQEFGPGPLPETASAQSGQYTAPPGQGTAAQPALGTTQPVPPATLEGAASPPAPAEQPPSGHLRITVGEPKVIHRVTQTQTPRADDLRHQAEEARRAGNKKEAQRLFQRAAELYQAEAQADPQARAVKEASADYCRRASEQCE
jgi:tetratricopeptide (TPR) repeat protein